MLAQRLPYPLAPSNRHTAIGAAVVLFHVLLLWALQSGLLSRSVQAVVPPQVLKVFVELPMPEVAPPPPLTPPQPVKKPEPKLDTTPPPAQSHAEPVAEAVATSVAPTGAFAAQTAAAPVPAPVTVAPPAPSKVELPSSDASYLQNPKPAYPAVSRRLGEKGRVVVRVLIGVDGAAQRAEIQQSSGFLRLDESAVNTVVKWRYVPGKRDGVPEAMWFNVPIDFVLG